MPFHANGAVLFSKRCNVSFFCGEIFVCKPRRNVSLRMYVFKKKYVYVCVDWKALFFVKHQGIAIKVT